MGPAKYRTASPEGGENLCFSTVFSTGVENFGGKPYRNPRAATVPHPHDRGEPGRATCKDDLTIDRVGSRWLRSMVPPRRRRGDRKIRHETHISAQPAPPPPHARLPRPHEHEERPPRAQAPPPEGTQTSDRVGALISALEPAVSCLMPSDDRGGSERVESIRRRTSRGGRSMGAI